MFENCKFIDLSHELNSRVPTWSGSCGFESKIVLDYDGGCRIMKYSMHAGVGTHIDAPNHFIKDTQDVAQLELANFFVKACVIDLREHVNKNNGYMILSQDILDYESKHGAIQERSLIIGYTGWSSRWHDSNAYRNLDNNKNMIFPGFSGESIDLLLERNIVGIGIDSLSPDGSDMSFPVHHKILGAGKYIIENLTNLASLPATGVHVVLLPQKIAGGTEVSTRVVGLVNN